MRENWKPVVGYEGLYDVSDHGRVRRASPSTRSETGFILSPSPDQHGYPLVSLCKRGTKRRNVKVHVMVARAFIGTPPDKMEVNHKDANTANAALENLEYVTHAENMRHASLLGLRKLGKTAKLTERDVAGIKGLIEFHGIRNAVLSSVFSISQRQIRDIARGVAWTRTETMRPIESLPIPDAGFVYTKKRVVANS